MRAVARGQPLLLSVLLKPGAPVNERDRQGHSPLMRAAASGNTALIDTLIAAGAGADTFDFNTVLDSTATLKHDLIKDFVHLTDKIDLSTIDADSTAAGNAAFMFLDGLGTAFTGAAGQVHFVTVGTNTLVEGDTNGDMIADFQIELVGSIALTGVDFIL